MALLDLSRLGPRPSFAAGLCTIRELEILGFGTRSVPDLVAEGLIVRIRRGCYGLRPRAHGETSGNREQTHEQAHERDRRERLLQLRAYAWTQYSSNGDWTFAFAGVSAAVLHGMSLWTSERRIHVVQRFKSSGRDHAPDVVKVFHPDAPLGVVDGLPVTSASETVVDCLRFLPAEPAMIACESALSRGLVDESSLLAAVLRARHRRGIAAARAMAAMASALSESPGETRTRMLLCSLGLPPFVQQHRVLADGHVYRLDFAWPDLCVGLEFDGLVKYFGPESTSEVLRNERERENALVAEGWVIVRITWADLSKPGKVQGMLERAFARARRQRAV